jgi:hypothetical protein
MPKDIISFSGRKHSGKTFLANITTKYNYTIINFADAMKKIVAELLSIDVDYLNQIKDLNLDSECNLDFKFTPTNLLFLSDKLNIKKEYIQEIFPINSCIVSIRDFLQKLGTDVIRKYNSEWHIDQIRNKIKPNKKYVFADTRFPNELDFIKKLNGECWFIIRESHIKISNHISELSLTKHHFSVDNIIYNNKDEYDLKEKWVSYMESDI